MQHTFLFSDHLVSVVFILFCYPFEDVCILCLFAGSISVDYYRFLFNHQVPRKHFFAECVYFLKIHLYSFFPNAHKSLIGVSQISPVITGRTCAFIYLPYRFVSSFSTGVLEILSIILSKI